MQLRPIKKHFRRLAWNFGLSKSDRIEKLLTDARHSSRRIYLFNQEERHNELFALLKRYFTCGGGQCYEEELTNCFGNARSSVKLTLLRL